MQDSEPDPSIRKDLCITADQSRMQRATNHHRRIDKEVTKWMHKPS